MNKELIQKDKEEKAIKFYTNYIQAQEKELDWMYRQDEEYYRDEIEQKELLIKGSKTILNLIQKQEKEIEELKEDNKHQWEERCKLTFKLENSTPNDKIKAKIEEVEQWELYNMKIPKLSTLDERLGAKIGIKYILQSLLEKE